MTPDNYIQIYFASLAMIGGTAGFVISYLIGEIKRLHRRVDEIFNILLERGA